MPNLGKNSAGRRQPRRRRHGSSSGVRHQNTRAHHRVSEKAEKRFRPLGQIFARHCRSTLQCEFRDSVRVQVNGSRSFISRTKHEKSVRCHAGVPTWPSTSFMACRASIDPRAFASGERRPRLPLVFPKQSRPDFGRKKSPAHARGSVESIPSRINPVPSVRVRSRPWSLSKSKCPDRTFVSRKSVLGLDYGRTRSNGPERRPDPRPSTGPDLLSRVLPLSGEPTQTHKRTPKPSKLRLAPNRVRSNLQENQLTTKPLSGTSHSWLAGIYFHP